MWNPLRRFLYLCADTLARFGIIDRVRGERSADLAWPRMVTGFARQSQRTIDLIMLGFVLGSPAVAGLGFAYTYWFLISGVGLGTAGGTVSLVSQRYGAEQYERIDLVIKQSLWVAIGLSVPLTVIYREFAFGLVGLLGAPPLVSQYGGTYLQVLSLGILFQFVNHITSRTLIGADDAWTPMVIRVVGAGLNTVLNAVFIFGFGLGVVGAALGTLCATAFVTGCFVWGFVRGSLPLVGTFPVGIRLGPPYLDGEILRQLVSIASPLVVRRVGGGAARFPIIALVAGFGTVIVAAYTVSRQLRGLMRAPNWGFGLAASSLVGQALGADDEPAAEAYGWDVLRFSVVIHLLTAVLVAVFARPIARLFVREPAAVAATVPFIWVATVAVMGESVDGTATGTLRAGGDTRWPMYGRLLGRYGMLPLVFLGTITPLGVLALYGALIVETFVPAAITYYRFRTGKWKAVSRSYRPGSY